MRMEKHRIATIATTIGLTASMSPLASAEAAPDTDKAVAHEVPTYTQPNAEEQSSGSPRLIILAAIAGAGAVLLAGSLAQKPYVEEEPLQDGDQKDYLPGR